MNVAGLREKTSVYIRPRTVCCDKGGVPSQAGLLRMTEISVDSQGGEEVYAR
jgi:hypothetical protein